jgi:hypothetical protein
MFYCYLEVLLVDKKPSDGMGAVMNLTALLLTLAPDGGLK